MRGAALELLAGGIIAELIAARRVSRDDEETRSTSPVGIIP